MPHPLLSALFDFRTGNAPTPRIILYTAARLIALCCGLILVSGESVGQEKLRRNSGQPYLEAEETVRRFKLPEGFEARVFAAEPDLINPIAMAFDERGRLYVVESFEYPKGTPPGEKPKDRIKIFEDTDGDHRADKVTIFAEGFNLATGIAVGHGGVFLGAAPDLIFLRDTDGDDRADTREVLLTGFGRQDTHELLNTFTWGPDGWLYGCHGVFTRSQVKRPDGEGSEEPAVLMDAAVWRYHPRTREFEIYAEGTSNPWGLDFDSHGNLFLTACVIPHLFHMVPGGRYIRQAGVNRNPYDFGQIKEISNHLHHEESGWAHAGCVVLEGELWPADLRGSVIFGSIHGNSIKRDVLSRQGSTFLATHAPDFLQSGDKNFRPVHQEIGPDGAIYITDWHDQWPCHQTPPDAWDKERGRVYKIIPARAKSVQPRDMSKLSNEALVQELSNPNPYVHRTAQRLLDERRAISAKRSLLQLILSRTTSTEVKLRGLWSLFSVGCFGFTEAGVLLGHPDPWVRAWTVRFMGELGAKPEFAQLLLKADPEGWNSLDQRLQLAAACQRIDPSARASLLRKLATHDEDASDPVIPLMIWFAVEPMVVKQRDETLAWLGSSAVGHEMVRRELVPRAIRRLAATGQVEDLDATVRFAAVMDDVAVRRAALEGLVSGLAGRRTQAPASWASAGPQLAGDSDPAVRNAARRLGANFRDPTVIRQEEQVAIDSKRNDSERLEAVRSIAVAQLGSSLGTLEKLLADDTSPALRAEVLRALGAYDSPQIPGVVLARWHKLPLPVRTEALTLLTSRGEWAEILLDQIAGGKFDRADLSAPAAQRIAAINNPKLTAKLEKSWGSVRARTPQEIDQLITRMNRVVSSGSSDAEAGRAVFEKKCAVCHKFNGKGADVGPDLTGADRSVDYLLINILDPNRVVGQPYYTHVVATKSGLTVSGKLVAESPASITIQSENDKIDIIPREEIEERVVKNISVMPEGLPKDMSDEEFRNLIEYLRRK